jgi:putative addiction module component (TIGR02574 family)
MSAILQSLGLDRLPRAERLVLVQELWDSIVSEPVHPMLTEAQRLELERRADDDDANPDDVIPWDEVRSRVAARLRS